MVSKFPLCMYLPHIVPCHWAQLKPVNTVGTMSMIMLATSSPGVNQMRSYPGYSWPIQISIRDTLCLFLRKRVNNHVLNSWCRGSASMNWELRPIHSKPISQNLIQIAARSWILPKVWWTWKKILGDRWEPTNNLIAVLLCESLSRRF